MTETENQRIDLQSVFAAGEVLVEDFVEDLVVWSIRQRSLHHLDLRAALIFDLVDGHRPVTDIVSALEGEFDIDRTSLTSDIMLCIEHLMSVGVIDYVGKIPP